MITEMLFKMQMKTETLFANDKMEKEKPHPKECREGCQQSLGGEMVIVTVGGLKIPPALTGSSKPALCFLLRFGLQSLIADFHLKIRLSELLKIS